MDRPSTSKLTIRDASSSTASATGSRHSSGRSIFENCICRSCCLILLFPLFLIAVSKKTKDGVETRIMFKSFIRLQSANLYSKLHSSTFHRRLNMCIFAAIMRKNNTPATDGGAIALEERDTIVVYFYTGKIWREITYHQTTCALKALASTGNVLWNAGVLRDYLISVSKVIFYGNPPPKRDSVCFRTSKATIRDGDTVDISTFLG